MSSGFRDLVGQDLPIGNDGDTPGFSQPVSQSEIEELLYSEQWPVEERLERLTAMRAQLDELEAPDFGDDDPADLIRQIDAAIASLEQLVGEGMDPTSIDHDPSAHRETLSPDSDELEAIEEADEDESAEIADDSEIDKSQWIDGPDDETRN